MLGGPRRSLVDSAASLDGEGMKLIRMGEMGREKPGVLLEDGTRLDVTGFGADYDEAFFAGGGITQLRNWLAAHGGSAPRVSPAGRVGAPACPAGNHLCAGLDFPEQPAGRAVGCSKEAGNFFEGVT